MNQKQRALAAGVAAACTWLGSNAQAAGNHTITVSASVQGKCTFNSANSAMSAITVDPTAIGNVTGSHTVLFRCTKGTTSTMSFAAQNTGGTASAGNMVNGLETLAYSYGVTGTSDAQNGTGLGAGQDKTLTVGVTVSQPAAADLSAGTYTDTIAVTVAP